MLSFSIFKRTVAVISTLVLGGLASCAGPIGKTATDDRDQASTTDGTNLGSPHATNEPARCT